MRIAFVAPFGLRAKGTARARALPLAAELARRGHTVALFIPPYDSPEDAGKRWRETVGGEMPGTSGAPLAVHSDDSVKLDGPSDRGSKRLASEVDVINMALPGFGRGAAGWHLWLGWRLFLTVRAWRPDVVHVFKPKGPSGIVGTLLWATRGRGDRQARLAVSPRLRVPASPVPRVVIDSDDWEGPGGWNDDPRAGYSPLQRRFFAWQERYGLSHADAWTVTSECLRRRAIGFGATEDRVSILRNGVALPSFQLPASSGRPSAILYTRFAGVRTADVAAIWGKVRERVPEAMLTVVGRGLGGEEQELTAVPGIQVQGWVEPAEMPGLFARMAVAVVPWADTPSNRARHSAKVLELMAAGLPIVAYAVGELPATLGEAGVLVPPGQADAFADAVVCLMADPDRAAALGAAAQARVETEFTWDRLAEVALAAYEAAEVGVGYRCSDDLPDWRL